MTALLAFFRRRRILRLERDLERAREAWRRAHAPEGVVIRGPPAWWRAA